MVKKINHIGIAVRSIDERKAFYTDILGLEYKGEEIVESQGVKVAFFKVGESRIELLEPLNQEAGMAKFIETKGEGIHHIAFDTDDVDAEIRKVSETGLRMIDEKARQGAHSMEIAFVHPKSSGGVLTEFCQKRKEQ
jgi:methylmalonyl-CoA/ethylmalonyl-CoA epimerase